MLLTLRPLSDAEGVQDSLSAIRYPLSAIRYPLSGWIFELVQRERCVRSAPDGQGALAPGRGHSDLHIRLERQLRLSAVALQLESLDAPLHVTDGECA